MSVLAIIPARGGSKGIPRKNIVDVFGKPLIAYTIEETMKCPGVSRLILSTDDAEIAAVAKRYGCEVPFMRPLDLARDNTPGIAPVIHAIDNLDGPYDHVVLLQPTSPLRLAEDIQACIDKCVLDGFASCVSVSACDQSPYWMFELSSRGTLNPLMKNGAGFTTRQSLPPVYFLNGAVYAAECKWLRENGSFFSDETYAYVMPRERSLDIDTLDDLDRFKTILAKRGAASP